MGTAVLHTTNRLRPAALLPDSPQVRAAEERADGLSLELQYAQGEAVQLAAELELAREAAERRAKCVAAGIGKCGHAGWSGKCVQGCAVGHGG